MAKYSIRLKDKDSKGKKAVYIAFTHGGKEALVKTPERLKPENVITSKEGFMQLKPNLLDARDTNQKLTEIYALAISVTKHFNYHKEPFTVLDMKYMFENLAPWGIRHNNQDFDTKFDEWINDMEFRKLEYNTIKVRKTLKNIVKDFFGSDVSIKEITPKKIEKLRDWMLDVRQYEPAHVAKRISFLRLFLNFCEGKKPLQRKLVGYDKEIIFLDETDLKKIIDLDVSHRPYLQRAKDSFLIMCYTGLRYSDRALNKSNVRGNYLVKNMEKTDRIVRIPLHDAAKEILERYDYELPKISRDKLSDYIKEVCKIAGITDMVEKVTYPGGVKKIEIVEKWTLISTHAGRKTFITYLLSEGVDVHEIMKMTGQSLRTIMKYAGVIGKKLEGKVSAAMGKLGNG